MINIKNILKQRQQLRGGYLFGQKYYCKLFSSTQFNEQTAISSRIKLDDIHKNIDSYEKLIDFYSKMFNKENEKQFKKFELDYYNEICSKQLQNLLKDEEKQYQQFLSQMLQKEDINQNYLNDVLKHCGYANLFPNNQKLVMWNILEKKQEEYQKILKKIISYINVYLKIFVIGYAISFVYRAYYYFEYDISIYHPRATAWHVFRFR